MKEAQHNLKHPGFMFTKLYKKKGVLIVVISDVCSMNLASVLSQYIKTLAKIQQPTNRQHMNTFFGVLHFLRRFSPMFYYNSIYNHSFSVYRPLHKMYQFNKLSIQSDERSTSSKYTVNARLFHCFPLEQELKNIYEALLEKIKIKTFPGVEWYHP